MNQFQQFEIAKMFSIPDLEEALGNKFDIHRFGFDFMECDVTGPYLSMQEEWLENENVLAFLDVDPATLDIDDAETRENLAHKLVCKFTGIQAKQAVVMEQGRKLLLLGDSYSSQGKTLEERMNHLDIDHERIVYKLSVGDAICAIADNVGQEDLDRLTDEDLKALIRAVEKSFENIEWHEAGTAGVTDFLWNFEKEPRNRITRTYNPPLAEELEAVLNVPHNHEEGPTCPACQQNIPSMYTLTGHVINDGIGMFVEKRCTPCGAITTDGHGEFHAVYAIVNGDICHLEDLEEATE